MTHGAGWGGGGGVLSYLGMAGRFGSDDLHFVIQLGSYFTPYPDLIYPLFLQK